MAVEVLSPQDCLKHPSSQGLLSLPMKYQQRNLNPNRASHPPQQPDRRKPQRKPARPNNSAPVQKPPVLLTGQVKVLKRGEELPKPKVELSKPAPPPPSKENRSPQKAVPDLGSKVRSGPNPKKGPKKTQVADQVNPALGFYAGISTCIASPPPSSLPLPKFSANKSTVVSNIDEAATSFFRNILRIES